MLPLPLSRLRLANSVLLIGFLLGTSPAYCNTDAGLDDFIAMYHCAVVELLTRIHTNPSHDLSRRFLILDRADDGSDYVQCAFDVGDRFMVCEAASGFYAARGDEPHLWPAERKALARLGFTADGSHGNFQQFPKIRNVADLGSIADLMLTALYEGYGARKDTIIEVTAPYALRHGLLPRQRCVPMS